MPEDALKPSRLERAIRFAFGAGFGLLRGTYFWLQLLPMSVAATLALFAAFCVTFGCLACEFGDLVWLSILDRFRGIF